MRKSKNATTLSACALAAALVCGWAMAQAPQGSTKDVSKDATQGDPAIPAAPVRGAQSDDPLVLRGEYLARVGDCLQPSSIADAVYSGHRFARLLGEDDPAPRRELPSFKAMP